MERGHAAIGQIVVLAAGGEHGDAPDLAAPPNAVIVGGAAAASRGTR
jgi:hypothetical protein